MAEPVDALILDLLEWISSRPRTYRQALQTWRTSCPRLPVWEEAHERGWLEICRSGGATEVRLSAQGREHLREHRA